MDVNSLPKTVTRQRRGCDLNPGPSAPESSKLITRLPSHQYDATKRQNCIKSSVHIHQASTQTHLQLVVDDRVSTFHRPNYFRSTVRHVDHVTPSPSCARLLSAKSTQTANRLNIQYIPAARSAEDRLQSGSADVQSPQHLDAVVPLSPDPGPTTQPQPAIDHYDAVSTFHDDNFCEARFSMLCTSSLELTTANCSQ